MPLRRVGIVDLHRGLHARALRAELIRAPRWCSRRRRILPVIAASNTSMIRCDAREAAAGGGRERQVIRADTDQARRDAAIVLAAFGLLSSVC